MLGSSDLVAFVGITDLARARAFYEATLGLKLVEETPIALVFRVSGTSLRVTQVDQVAPARYTVLGWDVVDIASAILELTARGVRFERYDGMGQDELGIWTSPSGARVTWFKDPDGNTLSLTQERSAH
jgi:catechol 2,3-dioxygenase-like lactoylglutathione lyase family enzyme